MADAPVLAGVTGTNGKTSTAWMLEHVLARSGRSVYLASTIVERRDGAEVARPRSHQEQADRVRAHLGGPASAAVLECTSAALAKGFARRLSFTHAVFTNLGRDHLDLHGDLETYLASKAQLFLAVRPGGTVVLNDTDPASRALRGVLAPDVDVLSWGTPADVGAQLRLREIVVEPRGTTVHADGPLGERLGRWKIPLVGRHFAENAAGAALALLAMGLEPGFVTDALSTLPAIPGRFQIVSQRPLAVVDYAHTPDAVERTCLAARALGPRRIAVVIGAGGERDRGKRSLLGAAAARHADLLVVTSDNPRHEDPALIAREVAEGARGRADVRVLLDRRAALREALDWAGGDDAVLVCGKGHERVQQVGERAIPFDDAAVLRELASTVPAADEASRSVLAGCLR